MKTINSLALIDHERLSSARLRVHDPLDAASQPLPKVEWKVRYGPVLHPTPMGNPAEILGLNLAMGCVHRCSFCSVRAHPAYPGDQVVYLYANTAEQLAVELRSRRQLPRAVFVSPSTDPFPPSRQVQEETVKVVEVLHRWGIEAWLMTRGVIRPFAIGLLVPLHERIKIIVGMTTLDRSLQRTLEPLAAPPRLRLRQIARLRAMGCRVQVAVEPLLPGLTDTRANLAPLLEALAAVGVTHLTAAYMFLRPSIRKNLERVLEPHGWDEAVLGAFERGPMLKGEHLKAARYLPKQRRQRGYAALMSVAASFGITVSVSGITNPDFASPRGSAPVASRQGRLAFPSGPLN